MEEPMITEAQRDELKTLCLKADVPDKSGELLTHEGAQHFIDDLKKQTRACPQLEDSQADYRVIHRRSADSELTDAPLRPSGRSMGQDKGYFART